MITLLKKLYLLYQLPIDEKLLRDYLRNLGLASVVGSMTALFLRSHNKLLSLAILFSIGSIVSYFGVQKSKNND